MNIQGASQGVDAILSRGGNLTRQREWRREAA
jgi:hypothetical protein